ncbi:sensor histidine kinase [Brevibacillus migulae]|uniref:sensor histidine kinase n=1 Tax=Brevibacillus migulae TaxID=1644114 RepID=UPI00106EAB42|nr:HAMP domain-containing sensor histidine kinase [Brevibacillus migulae]
MSEQAIIRKQQLTFMLYNFIAFSIIFSIFALIIFSQTKLTLYSKTDADLLAFKNSIIEKGLSQRMLQPSGRPPIGAPSDEMRNRPNPRMIVLTWNKDKQLNNPENTPFYGDFFVDLPFQQIDDITNITLYDQYTFRTISFKNPHNNDDQDYIQLLMNVDGEQNILNNYGRLLTICTVVFVLLSIAASFILSRKTMKPIIRSWNKQVEFVENASHELRTPLTIIQNKLELLLTTPYERIMDKFESIALTLSETRRLSKLTSDLLTLARADSMETQLVKERFDLDAFVQEVCEPYKEMAELQEKHLRVTTQSGLMIEADKSRLHQLMVILLDNALKYTGEHDSIIVKTSMEDHKCLIEVSDTGIGISEEGLQHIFSRFYREDKARTRETGGSGLGLSIAKWIVSSHGGTIQASHNKPKGTIFKIRLPK